MKSFSILIAILAFPAGIDYISLPKTIPAPKTITVTNIAVSISAYNPTKAQCDDDPLIMANNRRVFVGAVALSRDLEKDYGFKFGDPVYLKGHGTYIFADRMH